MRDQYPDLILWLQPGGTYVLGFNDPEAIHLLSGPGGYINVTGQPEHERAVRMARGRKPGSAAAKKAASAQTAAALAAIAFVDPGDKPKQLPVHDFAMIDEGRITTFDGILCRSAPFPAEFSALVHVGRLRAAFERAEGTVSVSLSGDRVMIEAGKLRVPVPTSEGEDAFFPAPDDRLATFDMGGLLNALILAGSFVREGATTVLESSVLLRPNSCIGTDRAIVTEAWFGYNMPTCVFPKLAIDAIRKTDKIPNGFGFSDGSFTFYFEDGSWIRTQLYSETYPDVSRILDQPTQYAAVPEDFFKAVNAIAPHVEEDGSFLHFFDGGISSSSVPGAGAEYTIETLRNRTAISAKYLRIIEPFTQWLDLYSSPNWIAFAGEKDGVKVRGFIAAIQAGS